MRNLSQWTGSCPPLEACWVDIENEGPNLREFAIPVKATSPAKRRCLKTSIKSNNKQRGIFFRWIVRRFDGFAMRAREQERSYWMSKQMTQGFDCDQRPSLSTSFEKCDEDLPWSLKKGVEVVWKLKLGLLFLRPFKSYFGSFVFSFSDNTAVLYSKSCPKSWKLKVDFKPPSLYTAFVMVSTKVVFVFNCFASFDWNGSDSDTKVEKLNSRNHKRSTISSSLFLGKHSRVSVCSLSTNTSKQLGKESWRKIRAILKKKEVKLTFQLWNFTV